MVRTEIYAREEAIQELMMEDPLEELKRYLPEAHARYIFGFNAVEAYHKNNEKPPSWRFPLGFCCPYNGAPKSLPVGHESCKQWDRKTGTWKSCILLELCSYCVCPEKFSEETWLTHVCHRGCCQDRKACPGARRGHVLDY